MKLNWKPVLSVISLMIIISGIFGVLLMSNNRQLYFDGSPDGWLSYWGGIFGSGIGVIGALIVLREQINFEKVDNTFFNLLTIHNDIINNIRIQNEMGDSIFDIIYTSLKMNNKNELYQVKTKGQINFFIENQENYIISVIKLIKTICESLAICKNGPSYLFDKHYLDDLEGNLTYFRNRFINAVKDTNYYEAITMLNEINSTLFEDGIYTGSFEVDNEILNQFRLLYNSMDKIEVPDLSDEQRKIIVEFSLNEHYGIIGNYFRTFHRIIKFVNENVKDQQTKANYIGFIRAMLNEKEMLVIYYNAFYTDRGKGLGKQLKLTNFFGTINDLPIEKSEEAQHFNKGSLLWGGYDIEMMRSCTSSGILVKNVDND